VVGEICHVEIPLLDLDKGITFYSKVFGWEIQKIPEMGYALFSAGDGPGGGFRIQGDINKEKNVICYIRVDDIEKKFSEIERNGGQKIEEMVPVGDMGWHALFADPYGNVLGLWKDKK
jgi:predicted enzyme related to lactoylglutathione lyase